MNTKNVLRTRTYMKINRLIKSCKDLRQLSWLKELVLQYHKDKKKDSAELLSNYLECEKELNDDISDAQAERRDEMNSLEKFQ